MFHDVRTLRTMSTDFRRQFLERFSTFSSEAKVAVCLFLLVGVGAVIYGVRGFSFRLEQPFLAQKNYSGPAYLSLEEKDAQRIEQEKQQDTDGDGINDYEEMQVYGTSPYLTDTDSDGFSDAEEIAQGKDPRCPQGKDCLVSYGSIDGEGTQTVTIGAGLGQDVQLDFSQLTDTVQLEDEINKASTGDLRQVLLGTGVDPLLVERMDDNQIRQLFLSAAADSKQAGVIDQLLKQQAEISAKLQADEQAQATAQQNQQTTP